VLGKNDGALIPEIDFETGFVFEFEDKFGIHAGAGFGERFEHGGGFSHAVDEHASSGAGGFVAGLSALNDDDGGAALAQSKGERKANDTCAGDDDVPGLHRKRF
jgi:hypothetical protein